MNAQGFPVSSGYFRTLGIRVSRGRDFNDHDTQNAPSIAMINQAMARGFLPEKPNVIGTRIIWGDPKRTAEIVGSSRTYGLGRRNPAPHISTFPFHSRGRIPTHFPRF